MAVRECSRRLGLQVARGERRAEDADHGRRMKAHLLPPSTGAQSDAGVGLDGEEIGGKGACARGALTPTLREQHRNGARGGVDHTLRVCVVVVESVDQHAVQKGGVAQG